MIHRIERGLGPRGHNRNRRQRHKHAFHVKQPLHTSLLHHSHHRQQKQHHAPPAQPPKSRFEPVTTLALFHVKHSAPVPTGARTHKHATTHQPRTNDHRQQAGCHPSAAPRSITHAHLHRAHSRRTAHAHSRSAPRPHAQRPQRPTAAKPPGNPPPQTSLTPASRAGSARGPHASARRPRRARSTR